MSAMTDGICNYKMVKEMLGKYDEKCRNNRNVSFLANGVKFWLQSVKDIDDDEESNSCL